MDVFVVMYVSFLVSSGRSKFKFKKLVEVRRLEINGCTI